MKAQLWCGGSPGSGYDIEVEGRSSTDRTFTVTRALGVCRRIGERSRTRTSGVVNWRSFPEPSGAHLPPASSKRPTGLSFSQFAVAGAIRGILVTPARVAALQSSVSRSRAVAVAAAPPGGWDRLPGLVLDSLLGLGLVLSIPLIILVVGAPLALAIRLVLWMTGLL